MTKIISNLNSWLKRQERIRNAVRELNALSDRDLSDIGISRCDIKKVVVGGRL